MSGFQLLGGAMAYIHAELKSLLKSCSELYFNNAHGDLDKYWLDIAKEIEPMLRKLYLRELTSRGVVQREQLFTEEEFHLAIKEKTDEIDQLKNQLNNMSTDERSEFYRECAESYKLMANSAITLIRIMSLPTQEIKNDF